MKIVYLIFMSLSVFVLSSLLFLKQNTQVIFGKPSDMYTLTLTISPETPANEVQILLENIQKSDNQILQTKLISAKQQLIDVESAFPGYSRGLFDTQEVEEILNPLIEIQFTENADRPQLVDKLKQLKGVNDVAFSSDWIDKFKGFYQLANIILNTIFVLFFIMLSFLISILIRNYLILYKDHIGLLVLSGATPHQAFSEQYLKILLHSGLAYLLGLAAAFALIFIIKYKVGINTYFSFLESRIQFLNLQQISLILVGLLINLVVSYGLSYRYVIKEHFQHD